MFINRNASEFLHELSRLFLQQQSKGEAISLFPHDEQTLMGK